MTTPAFEKFKILIEDPLKSISADPKSLTNPTYLSGSIRHEANALKKGINGRKLPALIASYDADSINEQKVQPKTSRLHKDSYTVTSTRSVNIYGVVATIDDNSEPGEYILEIDELLHDVKRAIPFKDLKFVSAGFILDNDDASLGLAGFLLKVTYDYTEKFNYD